MPRSARKHTIGSSWRPKGLLGDGVSVASTRDIAARAGVNQGLITYYFKTKQELWKAAAGRIFDQMQEVLERPSGAVNWPTDAPMPARSSASMSGSLLRIRSCFC